MSKRLLVLIIPLWLLLRIVQYYFIPYFINAALWILLSLFFLVLTVVLLIKLVIKKNWKSKIAIIKIALFAALFILTFQLSIVNRMLEKLDWVIFFNKRVEIVAQVQNNELKPNVSYNPSLCRLPFDLPILSNGGNDIVIYGDKPSKSVTVKFWISRGFFEAPQSYFVFTNDTFEIKGIDSFISKDPRDSWKIRNNWYRVLER